MSLSITQTPALVTLAQSPIIFTVAESDANLLTSSSFQYVGNLYYWQGGLNASSSTAEYVINKYPNTSGVGIFDLNRIINSTLTDFAIANTSNVEYYAVDFYTQYYNGISFVTGSHVRSQTYKALDGYGIFQEPIGQNITSASVHWPLMTDGPVSQSAFINNYGSASVYIGQADSNQNIYPNYIKYTDNNNNVGWYRLIDYCGAPITPSQLSSSLQVAQYPIGPAIAGFPLSSSYSSFTTQAYNVNCSFNSFTPLGNPITYSIDCIQKYPNVRIKWKNRYGQFDWFNFYMVNKQSFQTEKRTYQPQLGSWEAASLSYQNYDSGILNYITDSKQSIQVNSFWISESYNDILKQLLVSDEIYWIYNEPNSLVRPLTIATSNIVFKTGVVDNLIQYQFDFNFGQAYKLIL
jgi:hypothetical protein